jgi:phage regulator Rha-like protein
MTTTGSIELVIQEIRKRRVILAADLAEVYGVTTKRLNEQVRRNVERFPNDFMFQLTVEEALALQESRSQIATLKRGQNIKYLPYAFTEHGAVMVANVLRSKRAIAMSVFVVRAFVKLREVLATSDEFSSKLNELERKLTNRQDAHEQAILQLFAQIREMLVPQLPRESTKRRRIGF